MLKNMIYQRTSENIYAYSLKNVTFKPASQRPVSQFVLTKSRATNRMKVLQKCFFKGNNDANSRENLIYTLTITSLCSNAQVLQRTNLKKFQKAHRCSENHLKAVVPELMPIKKFDGVRNNFKYLSHGLIIKILATSYSLNRTN